jgi:hypothetical protein
MAIVNTIRKLVIEFVASVEAHYTLDTIAYRAQANQSARGLVRLARCAAAIRRVIASPAFGQGHISSCGIIVP